MANSTPPDNVSPGQPQPGASASIHDTYVYKVLSNPASAAAEIMHVLGADVASLFDWNDLELDPNRFVDENLGNHFTDLLFKTTLQGKPIRVRLMLEHSSYHKPYELLQVLRYQVRQWERDLELQQGKTGTDPPLVPIITILLHHSERGWRGRARFFDYFGLDEEQARLLRPYIVDFGVILDDISKIEAAALLDRPVPPEVQLFLFALRFAREGRRILQELPTISPVVDDLLQHEHGRLVVRAFVVYVERVAQISETDMRSALEELIESRLHPAITAVYAEFEAAKKAREELELAKQEAAKLAKLAKRGKKIGEKLGEKRGKREGERAVLLRQFTQRFGPLSPASRAKLQSASLAQLDAMSLRILTAKTIDEALEV